MKWLFTSLLGLIVLGGCSHEKTLTLRVMSYNIRHGEGMDHRVDLPRIAEVIRAADPDIVALQEVDRGVERTQQLDEPAKLGELTGMQSIFARNIEYQGGDYGNAVLTRLPVLDQQNHYLPRTRAGEQRGMLEVAVLVGNRPFRFLATHFDYHADDAERRGSAHVVRAVATQHDDEPVILAGDLNSTPESSVVQDLLSFMADTFISTGDHPFTFPSTQPDRRIDFILLSRYPGLRCDDYRIVEEPMASDHRPIVAVLSLSKASGGGI